ncbi:MAG TPA: hypothetical protein DDY29_11285 [Rhodobacteraceae bacterium]|nr:hypothetical protein [Paracoccaceae bacterium]
MAAAIAFPVRLPDAFGHGAIEGRGSMRMFSLTLAVSSLAMALPAAAEEPGSGLYAADCADPAAGYRIAIMADGSAEVQQGATTLAELLTRYSYFGDATPADFLIAVLFDPEASPFAQGADGAPRIEIWKGEAAFYALVNGDPDRRLMSCE